MAPFDSEMNPRNAREAELLRRGVRGGDGELPAIPAVPENFDELDEDALRALHADLAKAYEARREGARTAAQADELGQIREAQGRIKSAIEGLHATAARIEETDATDVALPDAPSANTPPAPGVTVPDSPAALDGAPLAPVDPTATPAGAVAAVNTLGAGDFAGDGAPPPAAVRQAVVASLQAGADARSFGRGDEITLDDLGRVFTEGFASAEPGRTGRQVKAYLASIPGFAEMGGIDTEAMLGRHQSVDRNTEMIHEAVSSYMARLPEQYGGRPNAAVAAICDPPEIIRTIPDCVTDAEPFASSLPGRAAGRLSFQFMPSAALAEVTSGVTIWDEADQAAVDPTSQGTWKPCVLVTCPDIDEVVAEAVTACLLFDNTTEISSPERVQDFMRKIAAAKARAKEDRLLTIASTFTHRYRHVGQYGAVPSTIQAVLTTLEQGWATNRLDEATLYNFYVPKELISAWVIDLVGQAFLQDAGVIRDVVGFIEGAARGAGKNVRVIPLLDRSITPTLPLIGGAAEEYLESGLKAGAFETYLIPPEGAIYFTTGEMNVGVERSPELNRMNRAQWFAEEYVGLAKHGCQPWYRLQLDVCENGTRAALTTPWTCEDAS